MADRRGPPGGVTPLERLEHQTIRRVTEDAERFHFHTAVAALMEFQKGISDALEADTGSAPAVRAATGTLLKLLHPLAPHLSEEWWSRLGGKRSLLETGWPLFDPALAVSPRATLVVQVNGRVRGRLDVERGALESHVVALARTDEKIRPWVEGRELKRTVYVPDRLLNLVV